MDNTYLKIDAEKKAELSNVLASEATRLFIESTKQASDSGSFEVMITTDDVDRMGETISVDGWDFSNYLKSPVVLWGHNYQQPPIGVCLSLERVGNGWKATGKFAPTQFAQEIRALYDMGMCRATSVGFIASEQEGNKITKAELLEFSFVSVPANPYALSLREIYGASQETGLMVVKSILGMLKQKEETPVEKVEEEKVEEVVETETKGAVQEELTAEQMMEQKYEALDKVFNVLYAMCRVYMDENTPVADFNKLLGEVVTILQSMADGTYTEPDESNVGKAMKETTAEQIKEIKDFVNKRNLIALESVLAKSEEGSEGNEADENKETEDESLTDEAKALLRLRKQIQVAATVIGDALASARIEAKKHY